MSGWLAGWLWVHIRTGLWGCAVVLREGGVMGWVEPVRPKGGVLLQAGAWVLSLKFCSTSLKRSATAPRRLLALIASRVHWPLISGTSPSSCRPAVAGFFHSLHDTHRLEQQQQQQRPGLPYPACLHTLSLR